MEENCLSANNTGRQRNAERDKWAERQGTTRNRKKREQEEEEESAKRKEQNEKNGNNGMNGENFTIFTIARFDETIKFVAANEGEGDARNANI